MIRRFSKLSGAAGVASLVALLGACGPDGGDNGSFATECASDLLPGDLVITEIMGNPAGSDNGNEWFEVYNNTSAEIDLRGVVLEYRSDPADELSAATHAVIEGNGATTIASNEYFVFGGVLEQFAPEYVDYGYAGALGGFGNSDARRLALYCDGIEIDSVTYGSTSDGESMALSNLIHPDHLANDDWDNNWCEAFTEYARENFGTPGAANDCGPVPPGFCLEGDELRETMPPQPGELIITEVMPNPAAVPDGDGEWFEIKVTADVDLNGLYLGRDPTEHPDDPDDIIDVNQCWRVTADSYVLFARNAESAVNGGLPVVGFEYGFSLVNSEGQLYIGDGTQILDAITWPTSPSGASLNLDPASCDPAANDDPATFCQSDVGPYGLGDFGTPGAANQDCPIPVPDGFCVDTVSGELRPAVAPVIGDLIITEVMPNPAAVGDTDGEWFEVLVTADVDLNGVTMGRDPANDFDDAVVQNECLPVVSGTHLLFAKNSDMATNGGLPAVDIEYGFSLVNSNGRLFIGHGTDITSVLDEITWPSSPSGASLNLDPDSYDPGVNDDPLVFCASDASQYGGADGDYGSPGASNQQCAKPPMDGMCMDVGLGAMRPVVVPGVGDLVITEFMANPDTIADTDGEWIEVRADADVDLNGLEIRKLTDGGTADSSIYQALECLSVTSGSYTVLTRDTDPMINGCMTPAFGAQTPVFDVSLNNSNNTIYLTANAIDVDSVHYAGTTAGSATSLDESSGMWCANNSDVYDTCLTGDNTGTPGASNPACP